ncbi:MAG TPA: AAA family ATPase, partial [Miltoncostaea sp.]|nr:AAA family ATPase [Miltoncostaea sp.]
MSLLERDAALAAVGAALAEAAGGGGRVILVRGEAGLGKTALVREAVERAGDRARVLPGACDPLLTPRALGPFHDIARAAGGAMAEALAPGGSREEVLAATLAELGAGP